MIDIVTETQSFLSAKGFINPTIGVILGTGLGNLFVKQISHPIEIAYGEIPNFPISTVESHKGKLIYGEIEGKKIVAMQGRFHYYEGYSMQQITFPVRVMKMMGVRHLLISNASGNLNRACKKGELMLIEDHINLQPDNPLRGKNLDVFGVRFPDMSQPYSKFLNDHLTKIAAEKKLTLNKLLHRAGCKRVGLISLMFLHAVALAWSGFQAGRGHYP